MSSRLRGCALLVALTLSVFPLRATEVDHVVRCTSCHGPQGCSSSGDVPHPAGQQAAHLARQPLAFKSGERN